MMEEASDVWRQWTLGAEQELDNPAQPEPRPPRREQAEAATPPRDAAEPAEAPSSFLNRQAKRARDPIDARALPPCVRRETVAAAAAAAGAVDRLRPAELAAFAAAAPAARADDLYELSLIHISEPTRPY